MSNLKINMNESENVNRSLESRTLKVCVVGIGRIGLPTALSFAKSGLETIGVDINETLVDDINSGIFPLKDEPGYEEIFHEVLDSKKFSENYNKLVSTELDLLKRWNTITDVMLKAANLPTKQEIEEIYEELHNLKNRISKLESSKKKV